MKRLILPAMFIMAMASAAFAVPMTPASIGPGNSWDVSWNDGNYSGAYDMVKFTITSGNATFDNVASVNGTLGTLANGDLSSTVNIAFGPSGTTTMLLSFADPPPVSGGVQVSVLYDEGGNLLTGSGFNWQWLDLPENQSITEGVGWEYLPVPDGGMTALLLGMGMLGVGWVRRIVRK